jgi:hypothetical protein
MTRKFEMVLKSIFANICFRISVFLRFLVLAVLMVLYALAVLVWPDPKAVIGSFFELLEKLYNEILAPGNKKRKV